MTQPQPDISFTTSNWDSIPGIQKFSCEAMATVFGIIIQHSDVRYAEQVAWAAFDELGKLESALSRFIENSDISQLNNLSAGRSLQVGPAAFECLQLSIRIYDETKGAFDITVGSLMDCWLNKDKTSRSASREQLNLARQRTGVHLLKLDEAQHTVQLLSEPVQIDLGGIGKGYAVDRMAELLGEWSIDTALIHAGYSSVLALGGPSGTKGWPITLSNPADRKQTLVRLHLQKRAVSGSGLQKGQHIIDPRTAQPIEGKLAAWACAPDAATADALSTAFMVMSPDEVEQYCLSHPDVSAALVTEDGGKASQREKILLHYGSWPEGSLLG